MIAVVITLIVSAFLVTFINIYCITIILYCKKLHKAAHFAILSLLLGHSIQGIVVLPAYAYDRSDIQKGFAGCDVFRLSYLFTNYTCCLSVLVISLDRFIAIQFPLRYQVGFTSKVMIRLLMFVWGYVFTLCMIPFIPSDRKDKCHYNPQKEWVLTMLFGHTLIPFFLIILCYVVIYQKITGVLKRRKTRGLSSLGHDESKCSIQKGKRNLRFRNQLNKTNVTLIIVAAYGLCWGPSLLYYVLLSLCKNSCFHKNFHKRFSKNFDESPVKEITGFAIKYLTIIDGFLTPLIYCCSNQNFNCERKKLFAKLRRSISRADDYTVRKNEIIIRDTSAYDERSLITMGDGENSSDEKWDTTDSTFLSMRGHSRSTYTTNHSSILERQTSLPLTEESARYSKRTRSLISIGGGENSSDKKRDITDSTFIYIRANSRSTSTVNHPSLLERQTSLPLTEVSARNPKRPYSCVF